MRSRGEDEETEEGCGEEGAVGEERREQWVKASARIKDGEERRGGSDTLGTQAHKGCIHKGWARQVWAGPNDNTLRTEDRTLKTGEDTHRRHRRQGH